MSQLIDSLVVWMCERPRSLAIVPAEDGVRFTLSGVRTNLDQVKLAQAVLFEIEQRITSDRYKETPLYRVVVKAAKELAQAIEAEEGKQHARTE